MPYSSEVIEVFVLKRKRLTISFPLKIPITILVFPISIHICIILRPVHIYTKEGFQNTHKNMLTSLENHTEVANKNHSDLEKN